MLAGELTAALSMINEARLIAEATGNPELVNAPAGPRGLARPGAQQASELIDANSEEAVRRRWTSNGYARSVLYNGLGRYEDARDAAWEAMQPDPIGYGTFAGARAGRGGIADGRPRTLLEYAVEWLSERTQRDQLRLGQWHRGTCACAVRARTRTPMSLYRRSIEHLSGTRARLELARSRLLYGEWLRRERRRVDAREQLRAALEEFTAVGAEAFARRAERELLATGARARKRTVKTIDQLTPRETQVAHLAADGHSNPEIAAQLFISTSTVEYHLRKAFRKLEVKSRTQLAKRIS